VHWCTKKTYDHGDVFYYDIEMENNDRWSIGKKKEWLFQLGQELKYEITPNTKMEGKFIIKEWQEEGKWWKFTPRDYKKDFVGFAMSYSKDLAVAWKIEMNDLSNYAEKMFTWMVGKLSDQNGSQNGWGVPK